MFLTDKRFQPTVIKYASLLGQFKVTKKCSVVNTALELLDNIRTGLKYLVVANALAYNTAL